MAARIGFPNEHLAGNNDSETTSPMYATAVGLVMNSLETSKSSFQEEAVLKEKEPEPVTVAEEAEPEREESQVQVEQPKPRKSIFDKWAEKFKDFLDNAE